MTKVSIITMHAVNNYGSVFQALATERIFMDLGCEVETLDYIQEGLQMNSIGKIIKHGGPGWMIKCKQIVLLVLRRNRNNTIFNSFRNKYLHLSKKQYLSVEELVQEQPEADIYCTGSDQTWNTTLHGVSKAYFLAFVPDNKRKIAFAASFGIDRLPERDLEEVKFYLSKYDYLSVREASGLSILKSMGFYHAEHVLDPTLVVDSSLWHRLSDSRQYTKDYILVYQLNSSAAFSDYVNRFAQKKGLEVLYVRSRKNNELKNSTYLGQPSPEIVLSLFKYSSYVITDSFHATVFSLLFHCNFINILPPYFSTRLKSILALTGLESRVLLDYNNLELDASPIDWVRVDRVLAIEREKSLCFLRRAIS